MRATIQELAKAWIAVHRATEDSPQYQGNFWAYNVMCDLCIEDPGAALTVVEEILRRDESNEIISNVAAGPLEDLLVRHGEQLISRIEVLAKGDERFRKMLGAVWKNDIPDHVWKRVRAIATGPW